MYCKNYSVNVLKNATKLLRGIHIPAFFSQNLYINHKYTFPLKRFAIIELLKIILQYSCFCSVIVDGWKQDWALFSNLKCKWMINLFFFQNNIAEVPALREYLMRDDFLMLSKQLLRASQIDVSYFAAGIISHLASESIQKWLVVSAKEEILKELVRNFYRL